MIPEHEFLLCAVRRTISDGEGTAPPPVSDVADWPLVLRLAAWHGLTPFLDRFLHTTVEALPEPCAAQLRGYARAHAAQNLVLTKHCVQLVDLFQQHSIATVPFKGPTLAATLYGDAGLRDFCDLDFLVRRPDAPKVKSILLDYGYRTDLPVRREAEAAYLRARHELHFVAPDGSLIEIHQTFLPDFCSFHIDDGALWQRLQRTQFCGREIWALNPEDMLLVLCAHGTRHCWSRIMWICDVAMLVIKHPALDWSRIMSQAAALGATRMVLLGTALAHRLFGTSPPPAILQKLREDQSVSALALNVQHTLFRSETPSEFHSHVFFLKARERLRDRLRYCARLTFMPNEEDYLMLSLPSGLSPLYYPFHAARVVGKYGLISSRAARQRNLAAVQPSR